MALDGIVMHSIANELKEKLINQRIDRIYQINNNDIVIYFRKTKLYISASGNSPRINITNQNYENPTNPPMFTMVLRKHLLGGIIKDVEQYKTDRIIKILISTLDEFYEPSEKSLIIEVMGRHSNIILLDKDDIIIDSITKVNHTMSRKREILPKLKYFPIEDDKYNPLELGKKDLTNIFKDLDSNKSIENTIFPLFTGFSKALGREIALRANLDPEFIFNELSLDEKIQLGEKTNNLLDEIRNKDLKYRAYLDNNKILDFHIIDLLNFSGAESISFSSPSEMLDYVYSKINKDDKYNQQSQSLLKIINTNLDKANKKMQHQIYDLDEAKNRDKYKVYADILSANLHKIIPGQDRIKLENFYDENLEEIEIPLDISRTGPQNAQKYYKKYSKLKNAENLVSEQLSETKSEIQYLESIKSSILLTDDLENLEMIKDELIQENYIKRNKRTKKNIQKKEKGTFLEFSYDGHQILVGRNNKQNDELTFKVSNREDIWLHARNIPGSHVIIRNNGDEVNMQTIEYAAKLAAYYSSYRDSGDVEVDYTERKNVKRHPAKKPGLVNYSDFNTILVSSIKKL